ncbi:putative serine/threonine-protein kinase [Tetrabaena socialis]|uniref:Putative serine/threonine-protein kinase n=1 Tax=Tetrabaena socialis TaxID=47790 RepID=A0A2J7ZV88_9CHLO|nr:putative serine/threonine-protein kinase [Tetrabaena socialis]|eukprot:PNH04148.1 putative serine/threonine-protein kinase [Tetrabaena socialis]
MLSLGHTSWITLVLKQNIDGVARLAGVPGTQTYTADPQAGCVNGTSAPLLQRCWDSVVQVSDLAMAGADIDTTGRPQPSNYGTIMINVTAICRSRVTKDCLTSLGPLGCMLLTQSNLALPPLLPASMEPSHSALSGPGAPLPQVPPVVAGAAAASGGAAGAGNRSSLAAVLTGTIIGGFVLVGIVLGFVIMHRRRQQVPVQPSALPPRPADGVVVDAVAKCAPCSTAGGGSTHRSNGGQPVSHLSVSLSLHVSKGISCSDPSHHGVSLSTPASPLLEGPAARLPSSDARSPASPAAVITKQTPFRTGVCVDVAVNEAIDEPTDTPSVTANGVNEHDCAGAQHKATTRCSYPAASCALTSTDHQPSEWRHAGGEGTGMPEGSVPIDIVRLLPDVVLGKGAYGRVYEGEYCGQRVAVKLLLNQLVDATTEDDLERFMLSFAQELEVLGRCEHPNIVRLLAASLRPPPGRSPCLVMEYMETSLDKLLYTSRQQLLPMPLVLHIAGEIALGLEYLHPTGQQGSQQDA